MRCACVPGHSLKAKGLFSKGEQITKWKVWWDIISHRNSSSVELQSNFNLGKSRLTFQFYLTAVIRFQENMRCLKLRTVTLHTSLQDILVIPFINIYCLDFKPFLNNIYTLKYDAPNVSFTMGCHNAQHIQLCPARLLFHPYRYRQ